MNDDIGRARDMALDLRRRGYNPLPSRTRAKAPLLDSYAEYWDQPLPDSVFDTWSAHNLQVMTGVRWKLCVVDCDGDEAHLIWRKVKNHAGWEGNLPTWIVRTGGGGHHYYFTTPDWLDDCPSRRLWGLWDTWGGPKHTGDWSKHKEIRLLGDRSLVIAPPSTHVTTGATYQFLETHSPTQYDRPMLAPTWLLKLPEARVHSGAPPPPRLAAPRRSGPAPTGFYPREDVLAAIPADRKLELARSWGLRPAAREPSARGWLSCHAIDRDDTNPSAGFQLEGGLYRDHRDDTTLSFFDLAVALGAYASWEDCKNDLGSLYLGKR